VFHGEVDFPVGDGTNDWDSRVDAWIKFVATASSDFGPAKAVIKIKEVQHKTYGPIDPDDLAFILGNTTGTGSDSAGDAFFDEAYVQIGDATVLMAGKKGSLLNKDDDTPLNWLGLFHSQAVDTGVGWGDASINDGGHVIQVQHDLGNGVLLSAGLEALNHSDDIDDTGTAVGVISYAGDGITAHVSFAAQGVLDGVLDDWAVHSGFTGTFDMFKIVAAAAFSEDDFNGTFWNVLGSASATFDMFEIAVSGEATSEDEWGAGASLTATVQEGVKLMGGARWFSEEDGDIVWEGAVGASVAVTESVTLEASAGYAWESNGPDDLFYGKAKASWAPGGGFTASIAGEANTEAAYKITSEFKKTFE
jgi:hypothetical protein